MTEREDTIRAFLGHAGWGDATRKPLAGDASARRYERLAMAGATAVLMDAPPGSGEDVRPFVAIALHLRSMGLSAPAIIAQDDAAGLLLLEDLGDDLFARLVQARPAVEEEIYAAAVDVLAEIQRHPAPGDLVTYGPGMMADAAALALDWYVPGATDVTQNGRDAFTDMMQDLLHRHAPAGEGMVLRDYHAENLIWLPGRAGLARVGLLDFQLAMRGHAAYDLVSLLQDARRDVPRDLAARLQQRFAGATGMAADDLATACALLGAQRNLRILGGFSRLSMLHGKPQYVALIPRVWDHLMHDLSHPALAPLAAMVQAMVPPPSAARLQRIKDKCGTFPRQ